MCRCRRSQWAHAARRPRRHLRRGRGHPVPQGQGRRDRRAAPPRPRRDEVETVTAYLGGTLRQRRTGLGWRGAQRRCPPPADEPHARRVLEVDAAFEAIAALAGAGLAGRPGGRGRRAVRPGHRRRAGLPARRGHRRRAPGRPRRAGARGGRGRRRRAARGRPPGRDARPARPAAVAVRRADRRRGGAGRRSASRSAGRCCRCSPPARPTSRPASAKAGGGRRSRSTPSSTASGSRCTATATRSWSPPARSRTSPPGCPRWSRSRARCRPTGFVLDGEALALDETGRPRPFQETASAHRPGTAASPGHAVLLRRAAPRRRRPARRARRRAARPRSTRLVPERAPRPAGWSPTTPTRPQAFFDDALARRATRAWWSRTSPRRTTPAAAAPRGSRSSRCTPSTWSCSPSSGAAAGAQGWLSNIHLGARDPGRPASFVMLGKTFKGMTDEMLAWQTERFLELETSPRRRHVVHVRPEQVVEIAFDGVQRSTPLPRRRGAALRPGGPLPRRQDAPTRPTRSTPSGRSSSRRLRAARGTSEAPPTGGRP